MNAKRKLIISMLAIVFALIAVVATIAITFALTQQTIKTSLNIEYVVEDIDGTASATFTVGGVTESLTAMKGNEVIGDTLVFKATDKEDAGNLMFPEDGLSLTSENDNVVIQYTYSNTGNKHYIASMSFEAELTPVNMKVEYSINGVDYSENRYAVVVPANTSNKSYWIKISIVNKAKNASFKGDFSWVLEGCDEQSEEYISLEVVDFVGDETTGTYSASYNGDTLVNGKLTFPSEVNGDPVTTIVAGTELTPTQMNQVKSVYLPDSVQTIGQAAFASYGNLETVTFEQNETSSGASVQSVVGLTDLGMSAFASCSKLKDFIIPNTVSSIGDSTFNSCRSLTEIAIPDSVTYMASFAFQYCSGLKSVTIGSGLSKLGVSVFGDCSSLTEIVIPNSVTAIDDVAFCNCTSLISVVIGTGVGRIGVDAFVNTNLQSAVFKDVREWIFSEAEHEAGFSRELSVEEVADAALMAGMLKYIGLEWRMS